MLTILSFMIVFTSVKCETKATAMANVPKGLLKGPKFNKKHATVIKEAIPFLKKIKNWDCVDKILLGVIKSLPNGSPRLKIGQEINAGFHVFFRGVGSGQKFIVYCRKKDFLNKIKAL